MDCRRQPDHGRGRSPRERATLKQLYFSYGVITLLLGRASTYTSPSELLQGLAGTPHPVPSPAWSRTRSEMSAGQREAAPTSEMEDSKRQNRPDEHDRRARPAGDVPDETLAELMSSYTPKQRETFLKGFRILVRRSPYAPTWNGRHRGSTPRRTMAARSRDDGYACNAHRPNAGGPLRQGLQREAGRGPLHLRPAAGAQGPRTEERLHRRPRVRGRGRERTHRRPPRVPQDDRRGRQAQCRVPGDIGLEVLPLHPQAGARRRLQVHAPAQGRPRRLHHRARRRHAHRQTHGGHHRERGRVLQRRIWPKRSPGG